MKENIRRHNADRISALPEPIIHYILSFLLNIKDVKITSSLSKKWYQFSSSCPYLDFHNSPFEEHTEERLKYISQTLRKFYNHNENHNVRLERLTVPITIRDACRLTYHVDSNLYHDSWIDLYLDNWIDLIVEHKVHEFNLAIKNPLSIDRPSYDLPQKVFAAKSSIRVAKFRGVSLLNSFPNKHISGSSFSSSCNLMKKLCLDNVLLDDLTLPCIISTCPLIEELSILNCFGINCTQIYSLDKLKTLQISHTIEYETDEKVMVQIDAPSLQSLAIKGQLKIRVLECPKLTNLDLDDIIFEKLRLEDSLARLSNLRSLSLSNLNLDNIFFEDLRLEDSLARLSYLRSLSLSNLYPLTKVKVSSHTLNKLKIIKCYGLLELDINAPNLLSITYDGVFAPLSASASTFNVAGARWDVSTKYCGFEINSCKVEDCLDDLRNFISKAKHFNYLSLYFQGINKSLSFQELNKPVIDRTPVAIIDHLDLCIDYSSRISFPDLFEGMLWSFHPRILSLRLGHDPLGKNDNNDFMKSIYVIIMWYQPARRSWLHCLEDVRYVDKDGTEGRLPMDGIFLPHLYSSYETIKFIFNW